MNSPAKRHAHMVDDPLRTLPLLRAIGKAVKPGARVVDIGTGLGILAIEAAKSGAGEVIAIDCDGDALKVAKRNAKRARVDDRITFIEDLSFDVKLSRRADLIVCETVGSFAFDENILASLADAKRRFLKRGGKIIPNKLELWGATCSADPKFTNEAEIAHIKKSALLSTLSLIASADFENKIPRLIHVAHKFCASKKGTVRSIAVWPRISWCRNEITDASPLSSPTHWKQGILTIEPRDVAPGQTVRIELIIRPHPDDPMRMTERLWRWVR